MCLAVGPAAVVDDNTSSSSSSGVEYVVTGSKDHYVKVFEVRDGANGVLVPRYGSSSEIY